MLTQTSEATGSNSWRGRTQCWHSEWDLSNWGDALSPSVSVDEQKTLLLCCCMVSDCGCGEMLLLLCWYSDAKLCCWPKHCCQVEGIELMVVVWKAWRMFLYQTFLCGMEKKSRSDSPTRGLSVGIREQIVRRWFGQASGFLDEWSVF